VNPLLIECARAHPDPGELRRLSGLCSGWDDFVQAALKQRLAPMAFWALSRACPDAVPRETLTALRNRFREGMQRNLLHARELFRLLDLFGLAGIEVLPFKGPALAWSLYETPGLRFMSDLDLLVPPGDVSRAIGLLTSNGYRRCDANIGLRFFSDSGEDLLRRSDGIFEVDLHWRVAPAHFNPLDAAEIRSRRVFIDVAGRQTPAFCPEDLLAYLCLNGAKNDWNSLAGICDLDRLIDVCRLDWGAILSRAARRRMSRIVSLGLCLAQDLLGSNLPPEVSSRVHADTRAVALAASIRERLQEGRAWSSRDRLILRFRLMEGAWRKICFFRHILRPTPADWELLHIPESLFPVYYLTRPVRLAWKWCARPILNPRRRAGFRA
jgi:hypothetical protein